MSDLHKCAECDSEFIMDHGWVCFFCADQWEKHLAEALSKLELVTARRDVALVDWYEVKSKLERVEAELAEELNAQEVAHREYEVSLLQVESEAGAMREALIYDGLAHHECLAGDDDCNAEGCTNIRRALSGTAGRAILDELAALRGLEHVVRIVASAIPSTEAQRLASAALQKLEAVRHPIGNEEPAE